MLNTTSLNVPGTTRTQSILMTSDQLLDVVYLEAPYPASTANGSPGALLQHEVAALSAREPCRAAAATNRRAVAVIAP